MSSYKISIIIPAFNEEKNIEKILQSAYTQTYKDFEVIVVDDGSTDNTGIICKKYEENHTNFKYIYKKNAGVSEARNLGLTYVNGEYVCFWDADDWVESTYLESIVKNIALTPRPEKTIFIAGCTIDYYKGSHQYSSEKLALKNRLLSKEQLIKSFVFQHEKFRLELWNKIFPKKIVVNKKFDSQYILGEDFEFFTNCLKDIDFLLTVDNSSYHYKVDTSQMKHYTKYKNEIAREKAIAQNLKEFGIEKEYIELFYFRRLLITAYTSLSYLKINTSQKKKEVSFILSELRKKRPKKFKPFANYQKAQKIMLMLIRFPSLYLVKIYFEIKRKIKDI